MPVKINILYDADFKQRLDKYLVEKNIPELYSRAQIENLIIKDSIYVNNTKIKKSYLLSQGDLISVVLPEPVQLSTIPQEIPLNVIYEDDYLAVINKAAGLVVHPGHGNRDKTLANAIAFRYGSGLPTTKGIDRPGIVHRLDSRTSGLIIVARDDRTQSLLSAMFAKRLVSKTYLAITTGIPEDEEATIETYVSRSRSIPSKMAVSKTGKLAITHYRIMRYYQGFALLKIGLETGRMHQIRLHMEKLNTPILGDLLYNSHTKVLASIPDNMKKKTADLLQNHLTRQALHAWRLAFKHPITEKPFVFYAPLPTDMIYVLDWLEKHFAIDNLGYENLLIKQETI
jgi:23S rRNA pseudouridine1911/1915/1917 synthase